MRLTNPASPLLLSLLVACSAAPETPDAGENTLNDGGSIGDTDAGETTPDAGNTTPDAGNTTPDAGDTTPDAGEPVETWVPAKYTTFNASGTRLKAHAITDANGNSVVAWFNDTTLGVRCTVRTIADGRRFCLPEAIDVESVGNFVHTNADCTDLALRVPATCGTRKYATWRNASYYAATPSSTTTFFSNNGAGCEIATLTGTNTLVTLEEADFSTFVEFPAASDTLHEIDASVGVRVLTGTDGTKFGDTLVHRATNRPARPYAFSETDTRLMEKNPFDVTPYTYERYSCEVTPRGANAFVAPRVDPVPAFVEVSIPPIEVGQNGPKFLRVTSTQDSYCDSSGTTRTVAANQLVYVLGAGGADLSGQPVLKRKAGTGNGTNLVHYLTAADIPAIPQLAVEANTSFSVGGVEVNAGANGTTALAIPAKALQSSWEETYTDGACSVPAAPSATYGVGDVIARTTNSNLGSGACLQTLPGAPATLVSLWKVNNEAPTTGHPYALVSIGGPQVQCMSTGQSMGGPPPPPIAYRGTTEATSQAATLLPALSTTQL